MARTFKPTQTWPISINAMRLKLLSNLVVGLLVGLIVSLISIVMTPKLSTAAELRVCPKCSYPTIKLALDAAQVNDTVVVGPGVYRESPIIVNKSVHLQGRPGAVLDGNNQNQILVIYKTNRVEISGFTIQNTGLSYTSELAGVRVVESEDCRIDDNIFTNTTYGIYLEKSHHCKISRNRFNGSAVDEASGGNGIHIWTGSDHEITNNFIQHHRDGIYLEFVKNTFIQNNRVQENLRYGLHFMFSNSTRSLENTYLKNGSGVAIMYSQDIIIERNQFLQNKGTASYGILLKDINSSQITRNQFNDNSVGIYMEGSNRSQFEQNEFRQNGYGLRLMGNCENNEFRLNNFRGNSFDVTTNSSMSWNTFGENYWSRYQGYDLNGDGKGDVPFRPVSLSSVVVESFDSSFYLIGSFLFDLLDFVERALPQLTPESLKDDFPLMKPSIPITFRGTHVANQ